MESNSSMTLVGKKKFLSKDKSRTCFMVSSLRPYVDEEIEAGNVGYAVTENFVPESVWNMIGSNDINREFVYEYAINRFGKPDISGIRFAETK